MLTTAENDMLTRVGPGTPCGELMRRYWHPIAATVQLEDNPVRKVRILGEDLVLFRDRSGNLGLIGPRCPHRAMHMAFGIPEAVGLALPLPWLALRRHGAVPGTTAGTARPAPSRTGFGPLPTRCRRWAASSGPIWGRSLFPSLPRLDLCEQEHGCGRSSATCYPATGCRSWRTGATSIMPCISMAGCSSMPSSGRDG